MQFELLISESNFLKENLEYYKEILTLTSTVYVGLLAFVYPKIFESKEKIKEKSEILYNKIAKNWLIKFYFATIIFLTIFNLVSFFTENNILLWLNIILCILSMVASWWIYEKILDKYYYREYEFIDKLEIIDYNKRDEKNIIYRDNLRLCQDLSINMLAKGFYNEYFNKYIEKILSYFELYIDFLYKREKFPDKEEINNFWNKKEKLNDYFITPFYIIKYIVQESKRFNAGYEFNINITQECYKTLKNFYKNLKLETEIDKESIISFFRYRITEPIWVFKNILLSKIEDKIFEPDEIIFINLFFELIIDFDIKYNDSYYTKSQIRYREMKTTPIIFDLIKSIIDNDYNFDKYIVYFEKNLCCLLRCGIDEEYKEIRKNIKANENNKTDEDNKIDKLYENYVYNLDFSILSYLLYKRKYDLFKKYYNTVCKNSLCHILDFFETMTQYLINKQYSIFSNDHLMEFEKDKLEYKYYVIFIILIHKKNYIDYCVNEFISYRKKDLSNKDCLINCRIEIIKNIISLGSFNFDKYIGKSVKLSNLNDIEWIKKEINKFFNIHEIINDSDLIKGRINDYKKFILQMFKYIETKTKKWQMDYQKDDKQ